MLPFSSKIEPCLIGMEACSCAHNWARERTALGYDVHLIPPIYVKPYVKRGKSDAVDAEAICEVVTRPTMSHPAREACIAERSLCCNKDWLCWYEDLLKLVAKEDARVRLLRTILGVAL
ncbi:MAG: transposase [bacterium]|jgi:transposase